MPFVNSTVTGEGSATYGSMVGPETIPGPTTASMRAVLGVMGADNTKRAIMIGEATSMALGAVNKREGIMGPLDRQMQQALGNPVT